MNLAFEEVRHGVGRFAATTAGIGLLFTVVLAMAGIYNGLVDDATILLRSLHADVWVVQQGTRGPFADTSRLDVSVESRVAAVAGVRRARGLSYQVLQREAGRGNLRFALVGLPWPECRDDAPPLVAGRGLEQAHGELVADASLGLSVGAKVSLAREEFTVVGLTRQLLASSGDAVVLATLADAQLVLADLPADAVRTERERRAERLRATDLGRGQPSLEGLLTDPEWRPPALATPPIVAVLVEADDPARIGEIRAALAAWPDVSVFAAAEEERLLLDGVVEKPRRQLALFAAILLVTSSVLIGAIVYARTLDKTHTIAVLKLMGAPRRRIAGMVLQQSWAMGALGYAIAVAVGAQAFPHFPRRVVLDLVTIGAVGAIVLAVSTAASLLGVRYALRVDPGQALEG